MTAIPSISPAEAVRLRMLRLGLWDPRPVTPEQVVSGLVAMQAQEFPYALWSVAQRISPADRPNAADMGVAYDLGSILRTHVMRPTWHFLAPGDARWMLTLTAQRVLGVSRIYFERAGLDAPTLVRVTDAFAAAVADGRHRTRGELRAALSAIGIALDGNGFVYALMFAELQRVLISGVTIGKQRSYAAFDERVPPTFVDGATSYDHENALAALASRYAATRGPVSVKDMSAWSGLTQADCRRGLEVALERAPGSLERIELEGVECWMTPTDAGADAAASVPASPRVDLLHGYDEYVMSYLETRGIIQHPDFSAPGTPDSLLHAALLDGRVVATWKHTLARSSASVELRAITPLAASVRPEIDRAVAEYGRYLGVPTALSA
ncbi:winged helix DNA-binding domain-containing protein [Orlajensenia leifsoniae]|uniref:Winged helix DNA-binding domain-containing protein n=1 Tax=Orlajensenia leifsoniae TaxID=2561933 RepID=A0A4Y9R3Y0_9MICO|nr:winged helix DNA-binding domain-containing protein [Leifsonia flava]TFV98155.1 winged helix DNA-binding domain-containing protein [Leifsonia flava]